jgi:hypothetical protein
VESLLFVNAEPFFWQIRDASDSLGRPARFVKKESMESSGERRKLIRHKEFGQNRGVPLWRGTVL